MGSLVLTLDHGSSETFISLPTLGSEYFLLSSKASPILHTLQIAFSCLYDVLIYVTRVKASAKIDQPRILSAINDNIVRLYVSPNDTMPV
jgi:hypothetical protein